MKLKILFAFYVAAVLALTGCLGDSSQSGSENGTNVVSEPETNILPPLTAPERTICDPFQTRSTTDRDRGVLASLFYRDLDQPRWYTARDYIEQGVMVESTLYFDQLFIPTRRFDTPFVTSAGEPVLYQNQNPDAPPQAVYEYFGLRFESQLQLAENESEGNYQLAVLSDDGAVFYFKNEDGTLRPFINNDGDHGTKMKCATESISMRRGEKKPFVLEYYQGPRFHISLVLMWRPTPAADDLDRPFNDIECDKQGNTRYFNPEILPDPNDPLKVPSPPTSVFYEMQARGWKVLQNSNFYFPEQASNPCTPSEDLLTTSLFAINRITRTSVTVSWKTNLDSFSQIEIRNLTTGTTETTTLRTVSEKDHIHSIEGLTANNLYVIRGISVTPGGQVVPTEEKGFRTPR